MTLQVGATFTAKKAFIVSSLTAEGCWTQVHVKRSARLILVYHGPLEPLPDTELAIFKLENSGQIVPMGVNKVAERLNRPRATNT